MKRDLLLLCRKPQNKEKLGFTQISHMILLYCFSLREKFKIINLLKIQIMIINYNVRAGSVLVVVDCIPPVSPHDYSIHQCLGLLGLYSEGVSVVYCYHYPTLSLTTSDYSDQAHSLRALVITTQSRPSNTTSGEYQYQGYIGTRDNCGLYIMRESSMENIDFIIV